MAAIFANLVHGQQYYAAICRTLAPPIKSTQFDITTVAAISEEMIYVIIFRTEHMDLGLSNLY